MQKHYVTKIGWVASIMGIVMFCSFADQIRLNMSGDTGSLLLPVLTTIKCLAWATYALLKAERDWPIICSNSLGIFMAALTTATAFYFA